MIRKRYKVSNQAVMATIVIKYATPEHLTCMLSVRGRPLSVARFNARQVRAGVAVSIMSSRKTIKGAFLRTLTKKAGDDTYDVVFKRTGKERLPIKAIKTVDMPGMFSREEVLLALEKAVDAKFNDEFVRQLNLILKG